MESAFAILAEPSRRALLNLLATSERSVGELERQLRMPQPSVSKHLRVLREAGFDGPGAPPGMGAVRRRWESGDRRAGEALDGRHAAGLRDHREAGRGAQAARVQLGWG